MVSLVMRRGEEMYRPTFRKHMCPSSRALIIRSFWLFQPPFRLLFAFLVFDLGTPLLESCFAGSVPLARSIRSKSSPFMKNTTHVIFPTAPKT